MIKNIAPDKWRHFFAGILMGAVLQTFLWYVLAGHPVFATTLAFITVMAVSYGFELFSLFTGRGHYDFMDAIATTIGGVLGIIISIILLLQMMF